MVRLISFKNIHTNAHRYVAMAFKSISDAYSFAHLSCQAGEYIEHII